MNINSNDNMKIRNDSMYTRKENGSLSYIVIFLINLQRLVIFSSPFLSKVIFSIIGSIYITIEIYVSQPNFPFPHFLLEIVHKSGSHMSSFFRLVS